MTGPALTCLFFPNKRILLITGTEDLVGSNHPFSLFRGPGRGRRIL